MKITKPISLLSKKLFASVSFLLLFGCFCSNVNAQSFPSGFGTSLAMGGWNELEGFRFDATGQMYVYEKAGRVWVVDTNGVKISTALLDIHDEVGGWRDHGLNGFALDPNFRTNGYYYLFYTVDRNDLIYKDVPGSGYVAAADSFFKATIARVTRYTADPATNFTTTIPGSRFILLGETKKTGVPVLHESHSGGQLVFGTDGSLLVSTGDGASYNYADSGGTVTTSTYWQQALKDSIIRPEENVGSFRSQMLNCLNGKILRLDPATGNGLPSNPYYDAANPRSAKSRVWDLGLRNPFRMCLRPGTGSTDITAGDPGTLYIGDVGWDAWEDLNVATGPGLNFGWPLYEGLTPQPGYQSIVNQFNFDAPNPLFGTGGCTRQYFKFKELCIQATLAPTFPNPCNAGVQIPSTVYHWVHTRPVIDWNHGSVIARTGGYSGNNAVEFNLNAGNSPVPGPLFKGNASVGGVFYTGAKYPPAYQGMYFQSDYGQGWLRTFRFNSNEVADSVSDFGISYGALVFLDYNPRDQFIYYVKYPSELRKLTYNLSVNNPPTAVATQNILYGGGPLNVLFNGAGSTDPEGLPLSYAWNFGDGHTSTAQNPSNIFNPLQSTPITYTVTLTVTDNIGQTSVTSLKVYVNNTPPQVTITSFNDGDLYTMSHNTTLPLQASVFDAEHSPAQLTYAWQTILHHNNHDHEEAINNSPITSTIISPVGCDTPNVYFFRILLTVTDAAGLSTTVESRVYPACDAPVADFSSNTTTGCPGAQVQFTDQSTNLPELWSWSFPGGTPSTSTLQNPIVTYPAYGVYDVSLTASSIRGNGVITKTGFIDIKANPKATITPSGNDTVCAGTTLLLTANSGSNLTYQWIKGGVDIPGATSATYLANGGNYKVKVTRSTTGCEKISSPKKITSRVIDATVSLSGPTTFCLGDSVIISVPNVAGNTYQWKKRLNLINGATAANYTAKNAGNYKVIVTDNHGCSKTSDPTLVTVNCKLENDEATVSGWSASVFPNPVSSNAEISLNMPTEGIVNIKVVDAIGRAAFTVVDNHHFPAGTSTVNMNVSKLAPGIYFVIVTNGAAQSTLKMAVQNMD